MERGFLYTRFHERVHVHVHLMTNLRSLHTRWTHLLLHVMMMTAKVMEAQAPESALPRHTIASTPASMKPRWENNFGSKMRGIKA